MEVEIWLLCIFLNLLRCRLRKWKFGATYVYIPNSFVQKKYRPHLRCHPYACHGSQVFVTDFQPVGAAVGTEHLVTSTAPVRVQLRVAVFALFDQHLGITVVRGLLPSDIQEGGDGDVQ